MWLLLAGLELRQFLVKVQVTTQKYYTTERELLGSHDNVKLATF